MLSSIGGEELGECRNSAATPGNRVSTMIRRAARLGLNTTAISQPEDNTLIPTLHLLHANMYAKIFDKKLTF